MSPSAPLGGSAGASVNLSPGTDGSLDPWTLLMSGSGQAVSATRTQVRLHNPTPAAGVSVPVLFL